MELRQLSYFVAIARKGSFSKAAAEIHVAQPALSQQIAHLEAELGVRLLDRHSRGVNLTESGKLFLSHAKKILADVQNVRDVFSDEKDEIKGQITFGMPTTTVSMLAVPLVQAAHDRYPGVSLRIVEAMTGHLYEWMENGELDLALLYNVDDSDVYRSVPLVEEDLFLFGHQSRLVPDNDVFEFDDLQNLPLITVSNRHLLRQMIDACAARANWELNVSFELDSLDQIKTLVGDGVGYTILPATAASPEWCGDHVKRWSITKPNLCLHTSVAASADREMTNALKEMTKLTVEVASGLIESGGWPLGRLPA